MVNSSAVVENLLRWRTDDASVQAAVQANQRVEASSRQASAGASSAGMAFNDAASAAQALGLSAEQMKQLGLTTDITAQKVGALTQRLNDAARVRANAGDATGGLRDAAFGGGTGGGNANVVGALSNARAAAIALPGVGYQSPLVVGIRAVGLLAEKTGASFAQLGVGLGLAGVAVAAVAIALDRFNQQLEGSKKLLDGALAANRNYYDALGTLTTEQVNEQIAEMERLRPILQQQVKEIQGALSSAFAQAQQTPLGDVGARALFNQLPTGALQEALDAAQKALEDNIQTEARLTQGREMGAFAANDAAAAEEKLAEVRKQLLDTRAGREVNQANAELAAQRLTSDERQKRIAELGEEIPIQQALANTVGISVEAWAILNAQLIDMEAEYFALIEVTDSYADRLARAAQYTQALTDQTDNYLDALTREIEAREDVFAAQQELGELGAENIARLQALYAERNERLLELETEAGERRAEIAEDSADRIARITRDAGREQVNAIANRDSLANTLSQQQEADALADQKKSDTKQAERLTKQLTKQEQTIEKSYNKQALQTAQAYDAEVAIKRRGLQQAQVDLTNAVFNQQQIALYGAGTQRTIHTQLWTDLNSIAVSWAFNTANTVRSILGSVLSGLGQGGASSSAYQIGYQAARDYVYTLNSGGRAMPS